MKHVIVFLTLVLLLVGCATPQSDSIVNEATIAAGSQQTQAAKATDQPTIIPTTAMTLTNTPTPTSTPKPTNTTTPTITPTKIPDVGLAKNYLISEEDAGIVVEVVRILITPKDSMTGELFSSEVFREKPTLVQFTFRVTNNTNQIILLTFYVNRAWVNGEEISFVDYKFGGGEFGDDFDAEILPGTTIIGGYWTGVKKSSWDDVNKINISILHATDTDFKQVSKDFRFTINVVNWVFEPLPDELK